MEYVGESEVWDGRSIERKVWSAEQSVQGESGGGRRRVEDEG
jgi:hypothetical protein